MESRTPYYLIAAFLMAVAALTVRAADTNYMDVQWTYETKGIVEYVWAGDLNGDGYNEVVAASSEYGLKGESVGWVSLLTREGNCIWTTSSGNPKCFTETKGAISALAVEDLDGNGRREIMAGVGYSIQLFDDKGGLPSAMWLPDHTMKVESIIVEDIDADGQKEIVVGADSLDKGKIYVFRSDKNTKWIAETPRGAVSAVHLADIDGDGQKEVIVGTYTKRGEKHLPGYLYVYGSRGKELWNYKTDKGIKTVYAADVDGDGQKEVLVGAQEKLYSLSSRGAELATYVTGTQTGVQIAIQKILVEDIDKDGKKEIILGANDVYALNSDYTKRWINPAGVETYDLAYADLNNDGSKEIVAATEKLFFIDSEGNLTGRFFLDKPRFSMTSLHLIDLDNIDGFLEIIAGCVDKSVYVLKSKVLDKKLGAEMLRNKANDMLVSGNYDAARKNAEEAKKIFEDLGSFPGAREKIKDINDLLRRISDAENRSANETIMANKYYEASYNAFTNDAKKDYLEAYINAQRAKNIYLSIPNSSENVARCREIIEASAEVLRSEAEDSYRNAREMYASGDYVNASAAIALSVSYYNALNDREGLEKSQTLAAKIKENIKTSAGYEKTNASYAKGITGNLTGFSFEGEILTPLFYIFCAAALAVLVYLLAGRLGKRKSGWAMGNRRDEIGRRRAVHVAENSNYEKDRYQVEEPTLRDQKELEMIAEPKNKKVFKASSPSHQKHSLETPLLRKKQNETHGGKEQRRDVPDRKPLPKVMKDTFRASGVSLRGLSYETDK